jgi:FkbM family methyltransferase
LRQFATQSLQKLPANATLSTASMNLRGTAKLVLPRAVTNQIRVAAYRWTLRRFRPYQVQRSWAGYQFNLWIPDPTAKSWYDRDAPQIPAEISFLAQHRLRSGATVFDCGAHQCVIAMILAKFILPTGRVVAVEASRHNYEAAIRNCRHNAADNVEVIHAAVSDTLDPIELNCRVNGQVDDGSGAWGKTAVHGVTVDELVRKHGPPDVLFVDVEGFESKVLAGAADTLSRYRPDCFFEMHVGCGLEKFGGSVKSITNTLEDLGYHLWMSNPELNTFIPFSEDSPLIDARFFLIATSAAS